jgi:hydrogenase/urease accessory protein HupE
MANIALAIFLILFGVHLVTSPIPAWFIAIAAVITGLIVGYSGLNKGRP